jgi:ABC-type transport system involved in multi-copper enzyme maturation permease subunit
LLLNFTGAATAGLASVLLQYWPFIILEGCWTIVSAAGIFTYLNKAKK